MALPTPAPSLSTTCIPVVDPAWTYTVHYSSGDRKSIFGSEIYTASTAVVRTLSADIDATCLTISPGQTVTPEVPFVGVNCSTTFYPSTTTTVTFSYTSGDYVFGSESIGKYTGTTTLYVTKTWTEDPHTYVRCTALPDVRNPDTCDHVTPLAWASLIITFIFVHLSWWLFDIPLLWKKKTTENSELRGFWGFSQTIIWACIRANTPGSAALYALWLGRDTSEYAAMYYLGVRRSIDGRAPQFTTWKLLTCIISDLLSIVASCLTLYQACTLPEYSPKQFGSSLWAYPSLPTALIGLCLLVGHRWFPRSRKATMWLVCMVISVLAATGVALALILQRFGTRELWPMSVAFYAVMAFPGAAMPFWPLLFILVTLAGGLYARVGGVFVAAKEHYAGGEPYCKMRGVGFAAVYMTLGGISSLLALVGCVSYYRILYGSRELEEPHRERWQDK